MNFAPADRPSKGRMRTPCAGGRRPGLPFTKPFERGLQVMGGSVMRHATMMLHRSLTFLVCSALGCATSVEEIPRSPAVSTTRVVVERPADSPHPLLVGTPISSLQAPCNGFRATSYSTYDPEGTRRFLCISREELGTLYAPEPSHEVEVPLTPPATSTTVFEIEPIGPNDSANGNEP